MTVATLGIAVDSAPLKELKRDLDAVVPAANQTGSAVDRLRAQNQRMLDQISSMHRTLQASLDVQRQTATSLDNMATSSTRAAQGINSLVAKYDPLTAAGLRYNAALVEIDKAQKAGTLSADIASRARQQELGSYNNQIASIERLAAAQKAAAQAAVNKQTITPDRGADIAAYGAELDKLRSKYNPLFAAGQTYKATLTEINQAAKVGALTESERAAAVMNTKVAFVQQTNSLRGLHDANGSATQSAGNLTKAVGLNAYEWRNLGFQVNDAATMLASGSSAFQVVSTQGGQVYQVLAGANGGVGGALKSVTGYLGSVFTVGRLAFGGLAAAITGASFALNNYLASQQKVQMSLTGAGRASGQSVGSINAIAQSSSSTTGLSVSEARAFAAELASTGKIGKDNLEPLVKIGHDIATAFGVSAAEAATLLGKAFADPVAGAEQLNQRLGFLDAAMQRQMQNLQAQGRLWEAQGILLGGVKSSLADVSAAVSTSTKFWTALGNVASNVWDAIGAAASRATGIGLTKGLDDQLKDAQSRLEELQKIASRRSEAVNSGLGTTSLIDQQKQKIDELTASMKRNADATVDAQQRQFSFAQASAVRNQQPEIDQIQALRNAQELLVKTMIDVQISGGPASEILKRMGLSYEELAKSLDIANSKLSTLKNEFQSSLAQAKIASDSLTAFSPGAKGDIARRQSVESTLNASMSAAEKATLAQQAYENSVKGASVALSEQARARALSANQAVASAQLDIDMVGKSIGQQAEMRANLQAYQALEQQSSQNRTAFDKVEFARLQTINAKLGKRNQLAAMQSANSNVKFDIDTAFLTDAEKQIASLNRQLHGDDWKSYSDDALSNQMRMANGLRELSSTMQDVNRGMFADFSSQIRNGASAFSALQTAGANALGKIADKLASMAADNLWKSAFGGTSGGGLMSLLGLGGGAELPGFGTSSFIGPMAANGKAFNDNSNIIPFANGGAFTNSIVNSPTLFKFANGTGMMGEAGPEAIMPLTRGPSGKLGVVAQGGGGGGGVVIQGGDTHITVQGNADKDAIQLMKGELAKRDAEFHSKVVTAVAQARKQRIL